MILNTMGIASVVYLLDLRWHMPLVPFDCNYGAEGQRFGMEIPFLPVSFRCIWPLPTGHGLSHAEYICCAGLVTIALFAKLVMMIIFVMSRFPLFIHNLFCT